MGLLKKAKNGDFVQIHFKCTLADLSIIDTNFGKEPLEFTIGKGQVIKGLERAVIGMVADEYKTVKILADEAFGPYSEESVYVIRRDQFQRNLEPQVGMQMNIEQDDGKTIVIAVTNVTETTVTLDANHPLAGKDLFYDIQLLRLKDLSEDVTVSNNIKAEYDGIIISKREFIDDLKTAIENKTGYATGKNGASEQCWMCYEIFLKQEKDSRAIKEYERNMIFHFVKHNGLFPASIEFIKQYNKFYIHHVKNLDCLGIFYYPRELEIINYYQIKTKLLHFINQEPDKSVPNNDDNCYLHYFRDKKILIICPFAEILKERAIKDTFEGVWSKTGKKWFYPKEVHALEFPYGFSSETHKKYATVFDLYEHIKNEINKKDFDIALIGAAGLAVPIASYIKTIGKIAIDLGGHLQIIFGVLGKRWRDWEDWKMAYFNNYWIDMPVKYRPKETDVCDEGAYW
jgi:peptidylprolyl isomerase